ncbi:MAG: phosphoenolpyruvate carboxylase, partial [Gemmatimonadales bacterium]
MSSARSHAEKPDARAASVPREPGTRPEDEPLHEDVRRLGDALGKVVKRLASERAFEIVDALRRDCKARRRGEPGARSLEELLDEVGKLPVDLAATTARAFTLFFLLINTAEQVHRVRRRNQYLAAPVDEPQPASAAWTMRRLREAGHTASEVSAALECLRVRPVLTAHPTESTRRTLLSLQARVADVLLERGSASPQEQRLVDDALDAEIELLWLTAEVREDRPSVGDEVSTVLWYLETRLLGASQLVHAAVVRAYEDEFETTSPELDLAPLIRLGTWVGGDRDGNPFVTPEATVAAARRASYAILGRYEKWLEDLVQRLSLSADIAPPSDALRASIERDRALLPEVWAANSRRNSHEPLRLKLSFIEARIAATRELVAARDAGRPSDSPTAYQNADAFEGDLLLVRDALESAGASHVRRTIFDPLHAALIAHGFHGLMM